MLLIYLSANYNHAKMAGPEVRDCKRNTQAKAHEQEALFDVQGREAFVRQTLVPAAFEDKHAKSL